MSDTVYAVVQLNGSDDIASSWPNTVDLGLTSPLSVREPYFKRENNSIYMYVGVGDGRAEAVNLRVKTADAANESASVVCSSGDNSISIKAVSGSPLLEAKTAAKAIKLTGDTLEGVEKPTLTGFNIILSSGTSLSGSGVINEVSLLRVPRLTLARGSTTPTNNRGYGTALPDKAELGEVFFLITE